MADNKLVTEYTIKAKLDKGTIKQDGESIRKYIESIGDKTINIDFKTSNLKEVERIIADMSDGDADVAALIRRAVGKQKVTRSTASLQGWKRLKEVIDFSPDDAGVVEEYTDRIQNEIKKFKDQSIGMSGEALKQLESNLYDVIENMLQQVYSIRNISVKGKNFNAKEIYNKIANNALKDLQLNGLDSEQRISKFAHNPNLNKKINMFNYGYTNLDDVIKYLETFSSTMEEWANSVVTIIQDAKEEVDKETSGNKKDNSHKDNRSNGNNGSDNQNGNYSSIQTETLQATDIKATTIEVNEIITKGGQRPRGKNRKKETAIIDNFEKVINSLDGSEFLHRGTQYLGAYEPITKGEALNVIFRHALDSGTLGNIASGYGVNGTGLYATRDIASVENGGEGYYLIKTSDMKNLLRLSKHPETIDKGDLYWGDFPVSNIGSFKGAETTDLFYAYLQHKLETYMAYMGMTNNGLKVKPIRNSLIDTYGMNSALLNNDDSSINKVAEEFYNDYRSLLKETDHNDVTLDQFINFFKDSIKIQNEMYSHIGTVIDDFGDTVKSEYINDKNYDKWQADEKLYGWQSGHSAASSRVLNELFGINGVIPEVGSFLDDYYHGAIFYDVPSKDINSIPFFDKSLANTIGSILQIKGKGASNSELQQEIELITKGSNILAEFTSSSSGAGNIVNFVEQLSKLSNTLDKNVISYFAKLWEQYSKNATIKKPFMPSIVGTEDIFGKEDATARAIRLFHGTDLSKINQGSIDEYLGAVKYLQQSGKTSHLTSIFNLLAELSSESKKIQATENDVSNTWGNYSKAVKAIKSNIRNYTDYLEVISDIMYAVGNSDIGETAYNGNRAISYNQGGSVNTPGNKKMAIDYHSHPDRGYDNAIPSRQDIVSYFETINEQLDEYGQAYLKKAYISNGNKILEMGFDNIDWSKVDTGQLQEELYDAINNAVKESGGGSKLNDKGEEEWLLTHDINTNDRISKSVRAAMLSVLSKYGGGIRVATRNGNGDLIDDATKEKWIADVKSGTVLNQGTEENFKKSVDVFDEAVDKFSTGNSKKEATGTADPISLKAIDDFILQLRRELLITETNPNVSGNAVADSLRQLINRTLTFRSTSRMGFGEWDNIRGRFTTIQSQNDIVDANRDLYDELIKIDQTLITLRATGQAQTQEYRNLQAERRNTISRLDVGNRAGYLQNAANENATLQVARTFFDRLTDIQNKTANIVNTKLNNGYNIDASFRQNYDRNNQSATRQLNALSRILNGDTAGIDITALFKRVVGVIDTLEQVQEDIKTNAVSMTRSIDSSTVSSRIRQFTSLGANEALKVDDNLRLQLNDYIERLNTFNSTNREDNDAYELLIKEGDELREQINSLDLIIKKYKETYGLRKQIAKLEITGGDADIISFFRQNLKNEENEIRSYGQSLGIDDALMNKIIGDPKEYAQYAKEFITKINNEVDAITNATTRKQNQQYGYAQSFLNDIQTAKDAAQEIINSLYIDPSNINTLREAYKVIQDLGKLKIGTQSNENVFIKRTQASSLLTSVQEVLNKTTSRQVDKEDRNQLLTIYLELQRITKAADKAGGVMTDLDKIRYDEWASQLKEIKTKYKEIGVYGETLFGKISKTIKAQTISTFSRYFSLYDIIRYIRTGINTIKELDTAMVELRKVTNATEAEYSKFRKEIRATAVEIASTNKDLISSAADWARLGYSIKEATELAKDAQIFVNVGDGVDIKGATDMMITAMKAFNIEAEEALSIVDKYNEIGKILPSHMVTYDVISNYIG